MARQAGARAVDFQCGSIVLDVTKLAAQSGIRVPPSLSMLGKTLLNLDEVGRTLDPDFDSNESIRRNAAKLMRQRMLHSLSPGNLFSSVIELKDLIARLPERINKKLESLGSGTFRVKVDTIDEKAPPARSLVPREQHSEACTCQCGGRQKDGALASIRMRYVFDIAMF